METETLITLLSIIVIVLIVYRILISTEKFDQVDICDYREANPTDFCKSIQKGCTDLINENNNLNNTINSNCTTLPTDTREMINTAVTCSDNVNKVIMNNYVQKEVCSQIKNFPPSTAIIDEVAPLAPSATMLAPSATMLAPSATMLAPLAPLAPSTYKPLEYDDQNDNFYINGNKGFAPF